MNQVDNDKLKLSQHTLANATELGVRTVMSTNGEGFSKEVGGVKLTTETVARTMLAKIKSYAKGDNGQ